MDITGYSFKIKFSGDRYEVIYMGTNNSNYIHTTLVRNDFINNRRKAPSLKTKVQCYVQSKRQKEVRND